MENKYMGKPLVPKRFIVGLMGCLSCFMLYVLRSNLSVAIIAMVDELEVIEEDTTAHGNDLCYDINTRINVTKLTNTYHGPKYMWSQSVQGVILGSYFYGYTVTQMLGSYADKFGAKWMTGLGVVLPALLNAFIPVLADIHYSLVILMRVLIGAFHGVIYACVFSLFAKWFPQSEKIVAISGTMFFGNFGGVVTLPIVGYLCKVQFLDGWPSAFYLTSIVNIVWFGFWCYLVHNSPEEDPNISEYELKYISSNNPQSRSAKNVTIPWRAIFSSKPVWASILTKICACFGYYIMCTKMPTYLDNVFGVSITSNSWFNSMMYGSLLTCAVCMFLIPVVDCNAIAVIALMLVGMTAFGFITGGEFCVVPEYAPSYAGSVFGVSNTLASTTGFIGPQIVGLLLDYGGDSGVRHQWNIIWYLSATVYAFGAIAFEVWGTAEPQLWAVISNPDETNDLETKTSLIENKV
ncbi:unnamed protein product [Medioppia subpectinata]|uniref:Sialin n=1 Tax=Medioppia subpectinata TaxID=1979941 RepID=A0A7R9QAH1_9ACAR|nr:unnamed protein product [Medioppia subpectinata]CAG2117364.1 unnamed protein product [Medioppia subpectinata]